MTKFECAVLECMADVSREGELLSAQLKAVEVTERDMTGVGFYTGFRVPEGIARLPASVGSPVGGPIGGPPTETVHAEIAGVSEGAGFLLWLDDGFIKTLEGYTYAEPWPESIQDFRVFAAPFGS